MTTFADSQALVNALRKKQEAWDALSTQVVPSTLATPAITGQPTIQQVDWGGILGKIGGALGAKSNQSKLDQATQDATTARLQEIASNMPQNFSNITPQQAMALSNLGVDLKGIKSVLPETSPFANLAQHLNEFSPEDAPVLAKQFNIPEDQMRGMLINAHAESKQRETEKFLQEKALKEMGIQGELSAAQIRANAQAAKQNQDWYKQQLERSMAKSDATTLTDSPDVAQSFNMLQKMKDETAKAAAVPEKDRPFMSGNVLRNADLLGKMVGMTGPFAPSQQMPNSNVLAQHAQYFKSQATQALKGQGSVTDWERESIEKLAFEPYDKPEVIQQKLNQIESLMNSAQQKVVAARKRMQSGINAATIPPMPLADTQAAPSAPSTGGWSIQVQP